MRKKLYLVLITAFLLSRSTSFAVEAEVRACKPVEASSTLTSQRDITPFLIDKRGMATPLLRQLLRLDHIESETLADIVAQTQKKWIFVRQGLNGKERCDLVDKPEFSLIRNQVISLCHQMGLFDPQQPLLSQYDYAICLGAFLDEARQRLISLITAWEKGTRFDALFFLGADRPLRKATGDKESFEKLFEGKNESKMRHDWQPLHPNSVVYETETDMLKLIWEQAELPLDMRQHLAGHVYFVNTPSTNGKRASTGDTYQTWLQEFHPKPGTILAASSPIVWSYQQQVGMKVLGPDFFLDTFTADSPREGMPSVSLLFDTIAKCLYEIQQIRSHTLFCLPAMQ